MKDWFTFRGRRELIVRGSKDASFRVCDVCRQTLYFSMGKQYLFPAPPADATIFETHPGGLLVPEDIYERVKAKNWRTVGIEALAVLDEPLDGFSELPLNNWTPTGETGDHCTEARQHHGVNASKSGRTHRCRPSTPGALDSATLPGQPHTAPVSCRADACRDMLKRAADTISVGSEDAPCMGDR